MRATDKISVTIERKELASAKRLAAHLGLSLSNFISDAVRERVREEARREAARLTVESFAPEERASPAEARALVELWTTPGVPPRKRTRAKPRAARRVPKAR